jgi:hypothetical protein
VAVTLAPPEGAGAGGVELDVLLDAAEHPTASTEHAAALRSRAQLDAPAPLTRVRLVGLPSSRRPQRNHRSPAWASYRASAVGNGAVRLGE